jgi:hypothetical protein
MAYTYSKIATYTVGSGGIANIDFLNIPQNYTDLVLKLSLRNTANVDWAGIRFNGVTTGYTNRAIQGTGAAVTSRNSTDPDLQVLTSENAFTASTFGNAEVYIPNYTSSASKSASIDGVSENNATDAFQIIGALLSTNTAPITSITFSPNATFEFQIGTTISLYKITKGSDGIVTTS